MWDERCSANFILPKQLSPQTSVKSKSGCPLSQSTRLWWFPVNLLAQRALRQSGTLRYSSLHFCLVPVSALRADPVPHAISREGRQWQRPLFNRWSVQRSRWEWLSDFAASLPGQIWGQWGPPSRWATWTWLSQQSAQLRRAVLGPPVKSSWPLTFSTQINQAPSEKRVVVSAMKDIQ